MHSRAVWADRNHSLKLCARFGVAPFAQERLAELIMGIRAVGANPQCVSGVEYGLVYLILPQCDSGESIVSGVVPRIDGKGIHPKRSAVAPGQRLLPTKTHQTDHTEAHSRS